MNKDVQSKYIELQMLDQQIKQAQKQIELVESQVTELEAINQSLQEFSGTSAGTEILIPLSGGVFAKAELKDNKELIVNAGAGVCVKKSVEEAQKMLEESIEELQSASREIIEALQRMAEQSQALEKELGSMLK